MRDLIVTENITLDGVVEATDNWLPGRDIVVTGSIALAHELIAAELVDEFRLFVYPVVVGRGRRLFPDGTSLTTLHPVENRQSRSGVTLLRYRTA